MATDKCRSDQGHVDSTIVLAGDNFVRRDASFTPASLMVSREGKQVVQAQPKPPSPSPKRPSVRSISNPK